MTSDPTNQSEQSVTDRHVNIYILNIDDCAICLFRFTGNISESLKSVLIFHFISLQLL